LTSDFNFASSSVVAFAQYYKLRDIIPLTSSLSRLAGFLTGYLQKIRGLDKSKLFTRLLLFVDIQDF